jgi:hypothetical protein
MKKGIKMSTILGLLVLGTTLWVLIDAYRIGVKRNQLKGFFAGMGPIGWALSCSFIWIIAFPMYLKNRPQYKIINGVGKVSD